MATESNSTGRSVREAVEENQETYAKWREQGVQNENSENCGEQPKSPNDESKNYQRLTGK